MAQVDNIDVAVLSKLNTLAERYAIKPYDFIATVHHDSKSGETMLSFEIPAQGNTLREARFENMLNAIGADLEEGTLKGSPAQVIDALDNAIHLAPKTHPRF